MDGLFLGIPFLVVTSWHKEWIFGIAMCKIYMTTTSINQFTSSIFLTVMSADRYVAVCHPISSPKFRTNVIARVVSLTAWATSALLMVPVFMYAATIKKMDGMSETCNIYWPWDSNDGNGIGEGGGHDNETAIHVPGEGERENRIAAVINLPMLSTPTHLTFIWAKLLVRVSCVTVLYCRR